MKMSRRGMTIAHSIGVIVLGALGVSLPPAASAFNFELGGDSSIKGAFDTDITYGYMRRST